MPVNKLVPELSVSDLNKSLDFYRDILGFKIDFERPEDRFAYLSFYGSELMIEEDREREGEDSLWIIEPLDFPRGRGLNISIDCPRTCDLVKRLESAGVAIRKAVEDCWYRDNDILHGQRNFLVQDPDGYLLRFTEELGTKLVER